MSSGKVGANTNYAEPSGPIQRFIKSVEEHNNKTDARIAEAAKSNPQVASVVKKAKNWAAQSPKELAKRDIVVDASANTLKVAFNNPAVAAAAEGQSLVGRVKTTGAASAA